MVLIAPHCEAVSWMLPRWQAQIGTKAHSYHRPGERLQQVSVLQFHNVDRRRRLPQLRELGILISTMIYHHPAYVILEVSFFLCSIRVVASNNF